MGAPTTTATVSEKPFAHSVRTKLVKAVWMAPWRSGLVLAQLDSSEVNGSLLLEQTSYFNNEGHNGPLLGETLVCKDANGLVNVLLSKPTGTTHKIEGILLGCACEVELVEPLGNSLAPEASDSNTTSGPHPNVLPVYSVHTVAAVDSHK